MIGKIVTGKSFKGAVEYVLGKKGAQLLASDGVDTESPQSIIFDLNFQRKTRPEVTKAVGHISLSFHKDDAGRLNDEWITAFVQMYMHRMGITGTQYIIVRHTDTEHPHLHIVYNRVKYDRKLVSDKHERRRNVRICKEMKQEYGLTFSQGKENVKTERLHGADRVRQVIYRAVQDALPSCDDVQELAEWLEESEIGVQFIHRGNDPKKEIQGMTFTKDGHTFKASQVDRKFSYGALMKYFEEQRLECQTQQGQSSTESTFDWSKFLDEENAGIAKPMEKKQEPSPPVPKEQPETNANPIICGVQFTDDQMAQIRDGQFLYLDNLKDDNGNRMTKYLVANDTLKRYWLLDERPDQWAKHGQYVMRQMDKLLVEAGFVTRAVVKWGGEYSTQTARPYLWKSDPKTGQYQQSWTDPRLPLPEQKRQQTQSPKPKAPKKDQGLEL